MTGTSSDAGHCPKPVSANLNTFAPVNRDTPAAARHSLCVLILNYNGWRDTISCLASLLASTAPIHRIIICDNGSPNGSLDQIAAWCEGKRAAPAPPHLPFAVFKDPPKDLTTYRGTATGIDLKRASQCILLLIDNEENLGFAAGNNTGLRILERFADWSHVLLLNNDTVVAPDTRGALLKKYASVGNQGMCGATLLHMDKTNSIQCLGGGEYSKLLGTTAYIRPAPHEHIAGMDEDAVSSRLDYINAAALLLSRDSLDGIGHLCEKYFLYYEDVEWGLRAKAKGYNHHWASKALVYHREGASTESSPGDPKNSFVDYHSLRGRLITTRRHAPWYLPLVLLSFALVAANRIRRGQWSRLLIIGRVLLKFFTSRPSDRQL